MTDVATLPATQVAVHYIGDGAWDVRSDPIPEPKAGEALIAVEAAGICGTDLHITRVPSTYRHDTEILGHEFCGRVVEGPPELVGKKAVIDPTLTCGVCEPCLRGFVTQCRSFGTLGIQRPGGFAEFAIVPVDRVVTVPDDLDSATAALSEPLACVLYALSRVPALEPAGRAVVLGGGPIGVLFAAVLERAMARQVVVVEPNPIRKAHIAARLQAEVVEPDALDPEFAPELVVDATGFLFARAVEIARPGGVILLFGLEDRGGASSQVDFVQKELTTVAARAAWGTFGKAVELLHREIITRDDLITATFGFHDAAEAFDVARNGTGLKVILQPRRTG
jgi:threonine dehydrogenase-like Zn-dependent dehydrogenase